MFEFPLVGLLLDYALALPFAMALALHNQVLVRPNFHLAAIYAATPLTAAWLQQTHSPVVAILAAGMGCVIASLGLDIMVARIDRIARHRGVARSFFVSISIYLILVQILALIFGPAPRSLNLSGIGSVALGGIDLPVEALVSAVIGLIAAGAVVSWADTRLGRKIRFAAGHALDVSHAGLRASRLLVLVGAVVGMLIAVASLAKAVVTPFSVYSAFPSYILCFCAAAAPPGSRVVVTAALLLSIYMIRSTAVFYLSAQFADAVTLILSLGFLAIYLTRTTLRERA